MRVASIVGTRPEFVQVGPVIRRLAKKHDSLLIHTGQHYDPTMSDVFFKTLNLPRPDYSLGIGSGSHAAQTGKILEALGGILAEEEPDHVLVYGDTNSTLAGALAAVKLGISVGHVEAGLRSYDRSMPEELNRVVVDHLASILFCPTQTAVGNLAKEGIQDGVHLVGDVMLDSAMQWETTIRLREMANELGLKGKRFLLLTLHRPSNVDRPETLSRTLQALGETAYPVVFPVHPRTAATLRRHLKGQGIPPNVMLIDPLGYVEFLSLLVATEKVLTDSGGVQKQAFFFGIPCITLRDVTEWVETVQAGWNVLVGTRPGAIADAVRNFRPAGPRPQDFGDGRASEKVVAILENVSRVDRRLSMLDSPLVSSHG